jgi:hypothetical protein
MRPLQMIEAAGGAAIVDVLAAEAGLDRDAASRALGVLLPELGQAILEACNGRHGARAARGAANDERYRRYLEHPAALAEPVAAVNGERVLNAVLDAGEHRRLAARAAAASFADQARVEQLMPLAASLAMAAIGRRLEAAWPGIPWFGSRQSDHFDAPLVNALAALLAARERRSRT